MEIGVASNIQKEIVNSFYFNFDMMKQDGFKKKEEFQVEFQHSQLIVYGYACAIFLSLTILIFERIHYKRMYRVP